MYKILISLFCNSKKKFICILKIINEVVNVVIKVIKFILWFCCFDFGCLFVGLVGVLVVLLFVVVVVCVDVVDSVFVDEDNIVFKRDVDIDVIVDNVFVIGLVMFGVGVVMLSG